MESGNLRKLGQSDMLISPVGLGTWQFSKKKNFAGKYWKELTDEEITEIVRVSLEAGINWFDSAEMYGNGESERSLAKALQVLGKKPGEVYIATKWWPMFRGTRSIGKTIHERLTALNGYPIDLYQIHFPMSRGSIRQEMNAMVRLVKEGKIKNVGVSNYSAKQMIKAHKELQKHGLNLASNQVKYNLIDRKIDRNGIIKAAKNNGISIIAYSPLEQAILTGRYHENPDIVNKIEGFRKYMSSFSEKSLKKVTPLIDALKEIGIKYNATPGQVALNWLIHFHGQTVVVIPGATSAKQAAGNAKTLNFILSKDELEQLDKISGNLEK